MIRRNRGKCALLVIAIPLLLVLATGCVPELVGISGGIGYLLGRSSVATVTTQECFLNGQLVDCSTVQ